MASIRVGKIWLSINQKIDITKIREGNETEIRLLAKCISEWTYNAVLYLLQNVEDTEEVVQDTILKVLGGLIEEGPQTYGLRKETALKAWTYKIALNKARDRIRHRNQQKRRANVSPLYADTQLSAKLQDSPYSHPGIQLESKETMAFLWNCIEQLPPNQKEALLLVKIDKNSLKDTAAIMKTTPKAVESLLSRAKANLKKFMKKDRR